MSMGPGSGGPPWRLLRTDRSVVENKIERQTVRRVLSLRAPPPAADPDVPRRHRRGRRLVVAPPLLLKRIVDDGISTGNTELVIGLAVAGGAWSPSSTRPSGWSAAGCPAGSVRA